MGRIPARERRRMQEEAALRKIAERSPFMYAVVYPLFGSWIGPLLVALAVLGIGAVALSGDPGSGSGGGGFLPGWFWVVGAIAVAGAAVLAVRWLLVPPAARERQRQARAAAARPVIVVSDEDE